MQKENENGDPPESPINGLRSSNGEENSNVAFSVCDGKILLENSECFYIKLSELFEASGLNLILNVRETLLNLHVLYKEVVERGGYYQVTKDRRWEEVAIALKLEGVNVNYSNQVQKVYASFLFQFEQIYSYRAPEKAAAHQAFAGQCYPVNFSAVKRKSSKSLIQELSEDEDVPMGKKVFKDNSSLQLTGWAAEQKISPQTPSKAEVKKKKGPSNGAQLRARTGYQIFLKEECDRQKRIHGVKFKGSFRRMADDAWRNLTEAERQPYLEESKRARESISREMAAHKENQDKQDAEKKKISLPEGNYHGPAAYEKPDEHKPDQSANHVQPDEHKPDQSAYHVQPKYEKLDEHKPDQSAVDLAVKNAPNDSILQDELDDKLDKHY
ncbi:hypothetical protein UlMin_029068 [Ulmus minor]